MFEQFGIFYTIINENVRMNYLFFGGKIHHNLRKYKVKYRKIIGKCSKNVEYFTP